MPLLLFFAIIVVFSVTPIAASAQSANSANSAQIRVDAQHNDACTTVTAEQQTRLRETRTQLEARIERLRGSGVAESDLTLRQVQSELISTLVALDCARLQAQAIRTRALSLTKNHLLSATVYYATNRRWKNAAVPADQYGSEFSDHLELGAASIALPTDRNPGEQVLPYRWAYKPSVDRSWRAKLEHVTRAADLERGRVLLEQDLKQATSKSLLLFVHGFWTTFEDAALRAAQTAHDIGFPGLVMFYSWPSQGSLTGYWRDEEMVQLSGAAFDDTVQLIAKLGVTDVYIIANSMGARLVGQVLADRVAAGKSSGPLRELLFAAADVNAEMFRRQIAPKMLQMTGTRVTIYSSSKDIALQASKVIHKSARVGETDAGIFTHAGMETIDASGTASVWRAFGHSYVSDSPRVLRDYAELFARRIGAAQRGLPLRGTEPHHYWWLE